MVTSRLGEVSLLARNTSSRSFFETPRTKEIGLHYIGSATRNRGDWLRAASMLGIPMKAIMHGREKATAPDFEGYLKFLTDALMIFNTGHMYPTMSCVTGRVFEAIYAQALLFEEVESDINDFFVPFVHYIPYSNIHELVQLAQFFILHPDQRCQHRQVSKCLVAFAD